MVERGGADPPIDGNSSNSCSVPGETVLVFDAVENPKELELESEEGEQFELLMQLNYEALAAKKRPALQRHQSENPAKRLRQEEMIGASIEEVMEVMNCYDVKRKSKKTKRRGRRKGSKGKVNPEIAKKLGEAELHRAFDRFEEAIPLLNEVVHLAPHLPDPYHRLGLIYSAMGNKTNALNFFRLAAHFSPKDASLWKLVIGSLECREEQDSLEAIWCLSKAIKADPEDIELRFHQATLYVDLGEYQKAADSYEQICRLHPYKIEVLEKALRLYIKCGQHERAVRMLEDSLKNHGNVAHLSVVDLLTSVLMERSEYARALEHIECTQNECSTRKEIPLYLTIKAGICHVHLGDLEKAKAHFNILEPEVISAHPHLIIEVADSLMTIGHYESALKYYIVLEEDADLYLKIARCYVSLKKGAQAIEYYYKAVEKLDDSIDARLVLSSLLLEEDRDAEAISVLSPPVESALDTKSDTHAMWWRSGKIKLKLAQIYKAEGSLEAFVDVLFPVIHETLFLETVQQKVRSRKRLSVSELSERAKVLDDNQTDNLFRGFSRLASSADLYKAGRAKKLLQKKAAVKEAKRAAASAAGYDWKSDDSDNEFPARKSDDSDNEFPKVLRKTPLPDFLKEEENHLLIVDLCKSLSSLKRYREALEIIDLSLKLECNKLSVQMKESLRTLGAHIGCNIGDPAHGWNHVLYNVNQHPHSFSAWNCYYKGILRSNRLAKRNKFLCSMKMKHKDCVPPILVTGHLCTMQSQHQAAACEYLEAHKMMPDNPLINLCVGTALINLALGNRLQNKHQAVLQGLAFLHHNTRICGDSQESLYNIGRAYHHLGMVTLAAKYYEKVLAIRENDYPIPILPNDNSNDTDIKRPGYCDLRREAAYNLHLIYKGSGAFDLARQVLKDHLVL